MMIVGATLAYLLESIIVFALCSLWVVALLDIQSQMRRGASSYKILVFIALAISVLAVYLVVAVDAFFIDSRSEPLSPWSDWGVRLGS